MKKDSKNTYLLFIASIVSLIAICCICTLLKYNYMYEKGFQEDFLIGSYEHITDETVESIAVTSEDLLYYTGNDGKPIKIKIKKLDAPNLYKVISTDSSCELNNALILFQKRSLFVTVDDRVKEFKKFNSNAVIIDREIKE